jgi:hypothetical protein
MRLWCIKMLMRRQSTPWWVFALPGNLRLLATELKRLTARTNNHD